MKKNRSHFYKLSFCTALCCSNASLKLMGNRFFRHKLVNHDDEIDASFNTAHLFVSIPFLFFQILCDKLVACALFQTAKRVIRQNPQIQYLDWFSAFWPICNFLPSFLVHLPVCLIFVKNHRLCEPRLKYGPKRRNFHFNFEIDSSCCSRCSFYFLFS